MDDVVIYGDIETEAEGLSYGAMVFKVMPGVTTAPHSHASEETWIVLSGEGHCAIAGERIGLIADTHITVPAETVHSISNTAANDLVVLGLWWKRL